VSLLDCGCGEDLKRAYHLAILTLCAGGAIYNGLAFRKRREPHLLIMAGLYLAGVIGERYVCRQHAGVTDPVRARRTRGRHTRSCTRV
jgi:hypothetical protein